jgi:putative transcriptional regulator
MKGGDFPKGGLSGSLLVAHPGLVDPPFRKTILFLSHHDIETGAVAYVINRPLDSALPHPAGLIELYYGGPVEPDSLTIASLQWRKPQGFVAFHTMEASELDIPQEWRDGLRAFTGYAGWSPGQLESEIQQKAWLVLPPSEALIQMKNPGTAWAEIMKKAGPLLALLAAAPDDPSRN